MSHDASAALIKDGEILACVQEERLNRIKLAYTFPIKAIGSVFDITGIKPVDVQIVAWTSVVPLTKPQMSFLLNGNPNTSIEDMTALEKLFIVPRLFDHVLSVRSRQSTDVSVQSAEKLLARKLADNFGLLAPLIRFDHHMCHAASAYLTSGFDDALVVTSDGAGDRLSGSISIGQQGRLHRKGEVLESDASLGMLYSEVTRALGYKPNRHEGKITGLAAHGDPDKTKSKYESLMGLSENGLGIKNKSNDYNPIWFFIKNPWYALKYVGARIDHFRSLHHYHWLRQKVDEMAEKHSPEDMAAGVQSFTEQITVDWIDNNAQHIGIDKFTGKVALAGGLFANVRVNAQVAELPWVTELSIHPNMGDGGLAVGAAFLAATSEVTIQPKAIPHVYLGPAYSEEEIEEALCEGGLNYNRSDDIENLIVERLVDNKIVARFHGAMEYGPRALGNRSILYNPADASVNHWLNEKLNRTEFMPFAPVCLEELAEELFINVTKSLDSARFMTVAYTVSDQFKQKCPAVVHVDNTARPQLVNKEINPSLYKIVNNYYEQTGIPAVLNTSFNMHEEPIVCTPADAVRSFVASKLDCLAIGDFFCDGDIS